MSPTRKASTPAPAAASQTNKAATSRRSPTTLAIDIGGTGLKASVLDPAGELLVDRVRVDTPYPCSPQLLVSTLKDLVAPLPPFDRVSAGFPGMVRRGLILSASHLATAHGTGSKEVPDLVKAWANYDLAAALTDALGKPTRVANDADLAGSAVVKGTGLEVVITLGTGLGTAVFWDGALAPHMELSHLPFRKGESYDDQVGDAARKRLGDKRWSKRVAEAVENIRALLMYDHLYVGGGNSHRVTIDLGPNVTVVDNVAGITGGVKLWERSAS